MVVVWLFVLLLFWWVLTMAHDRQAGGPDTRAPASPLGSAGVARVAHSSGHSVERGFRESGVEITLSGAPI